MFIDFIFVRFSISFTLFAALLLLSDDAARLLARCFVLLDAKMLDDGREFFTWKTMKKTTTIHKNSRGEWNNFLLTTNQFEIWFFFFHGAMKLIWCHYSVSIEHLKAIISFYAVKQSFDHIFFSSSFVYHFSNSGWLAGSLACSRHSFPNCLFNDKTTKVFTYWL